MARRSWWMRALLWVLAGMLLIAVFMSYTQPELMQQLSEQLWSCF